MNIEQGQYVIWEKLIAKFPSNENFYHTIRIFPQVEIRNWAGAGGGSGVFFVFHPITFLCLVSLCLKESFLKEPEIGWKVTKTCHTHMISDFVQEIGI